MLHTQFTLSDHAALRMSQRNCSLGDIEYVLNHGQRVHSAGVTTYFLGRKDIPEGDQKIPDIARREGIAVLTKHLENGTLIVITVYRNREALKTARQKPKYDSRKFGSQTEPLALAS